ncbi:peroxidase [Condylostylus longicornis]|uniref:peroxidase n=1 Tax=Condylostylus longicornis TaxID=2530218 RepID=UPI00244DC279|nr:peroxidase [Condylostylus longicornis]
MNIQTIFKLSLNIILVLPIMVIGIYEFPTYSDYKLSGNDERILNQLTDSDLKSFIELGIQSIQSKDILERNLLNSEITVQNGSLSHATYLETLPSDDAKKDDRIASEILQSSLYILNSFCLPHGLSGKDCQRIFSKTSLPESSLQQNCQLINSKLRIGHSAFRRLLPANYEDGFYKIYGPPSLPKPREISKIVAINNKNNMHNSEEDASRNLIVVQWAQFIEHDLSKPVVKSMNNGKPIECCDSDYYKLSPRYQHPSCAPLEGITHSKYDFVSCLNYVRSALAVNPLCKFGAAEQLNEAVGGLDLSQLYGIPNSESQMRLYKNGKLKSSMPKSARLPFLPKAVNSEKYCVENSSECFMAGDSRVNNNPFATMIYTLFLRSHNRIARKLKGKYPNWSDNQLYLESKKINIAMYREIIYNEWIPATLGENIAQQINEEPLKYFHDINQFGTSNEFGIAAIRFYFSMMPNVLYEQIKPFGRKLEETNIIDVGISSDGPLTKLFSLKDQFYSSNFTGNPQKMNSAFSAMLIQKAMKMDSKYSESMSKYYLQTKSSSNKVNGLDSLAWDIQRNRDHGLQPYVKYLEKCENTKITTWGDLAQYIDSENIEKLKLVYKNLENIDLIIGGISENPKRDSAVGPTFTCILAEQFSNTRQLHYNLQNRNLESIENMYDNNNKQFGSWTAAKLLCDTTALKSVPKNIFMVPSERALAQQENKNQNKNSNVPSSEKSQTG